MVHGTGSDLCWGYLWSDEERKEESDDEVVEDR